MARCRAGLPAPRLEGPPPPTKPSEWVEICAENKKAAEEPPRTEHDFLQEQLCHGVVDRQEKVWPWPVQIYVIRTNCARQKWLARFGAAAPSRSAPNSTDRTCAGLFITQGHHRIDSHCTACRNVTCRESDESQQECDAGKSKRVGGGHADEEAR